MLGNIEGKRRRCQQRMRCLDRITNSMNMNLSKLQEIIKNREAWHDAVHGTTKSWTCLSNWTSVFMYYLNFIQYGLQGASQAVQVKKSTSQCRRHKRCGFDPWIWKIPWSQKWQSAPVSLLGKFYGQRRLVGYSPWGHALMQTHTNTHTHTHTHTKFTRSWISGNKEQWSWELGNKGRESYSFPVSLPWRFPGCSAVMQDLRSLTVYVNWGDNGWALETQIARVKILEYWEEKAAQRNISEHLNAVSYL